MRPATRPASLRSGCARLERALASRFVVAAAVLTAALAPEVPPREPLAP